MRKGIHPLQRVVRIINTKGASCLAASVAQPAAGRIFLQYDTASHPAWTGRKAAVTNTGRVAKFNLRFGSQPPAAAATASPPAAAQ